jgi:hypothetical protein
MTIRTLVLGFIATSALVVAAGCSAEVPVDEAVQASISEAPVETQGITGTQAAFILGTAAECQGTSTKTLAQATKLLKYAFGDDAAATFPSGAACSAVQSSLLALRSALTNTSVSVDNVTGIYTVCTYTNRTQIYHIVDNSGQGTILPPIITSLQANVPTCFGNGVLGYLMPTPGSAVAGRKPEMYMDPEPATLTANLAATAGASAAAYYAETGGTTTVKKWSSSYTSCGTFVGGGEPCSTIALSTGATASQLVQKYNTLCRCL